MNKKTERVLEYKQTKIKKRTNLKGWKSLWLKKNHLI